VVGAPVIEFELPEPEYRELTLDSRVAHRGRDDAPEEESLKGLVRVDGPRGWRLTADQVRAADPEIGTYMGPDPDRNGYYFVYLTVSFTARGARKLASAEVKIALAAEPDTPPPFALSMKPLKDGDPVSVERTASLGPKLKLLDAVEAEIGHADRKRSFKETNLFVRGLLSGSRPRWEFTRTDSRRLDGACTLQMVVQAGLGCALTVTGEVTARTTGNIVLPFGANLPDPLHLDPFHLDKETA
jgi:hypothetical protein